MSAAVSTSYTDDELDVLDALGLLERARGKSPRSTMQGEIVRERLAYVVMHDPEVREFVEQRRRRRAERAGQQRLHLRVVEGGR